MVLWLRASTALPALPSLVGASNPHWAAHTHLYLQFKELKRPLLDARTHVYKPTEGTQAHTHNLKIFKKKKTFKMILFKNTLETVWVLCRQPFYKRDLSTVPWSVGSWKTFLESTAHREKKEQMCPIL